MLKEDCLMLQKIFKAHANAQSLTNSSNLSVCLLKGLVLISTSVIKFMKIEFETLSKLQNQVIE